jgi:RIO kinase 1
VSDTWEEQKGRPQQMTQEERKAHKKQVKAAARERRKTKIPKHVKKKATKSSKH